MKLSVDEVKEYILRLERAKLFGTALIGIVGPVVDVVGDYYRERLQEDEFRELIAQGCTPEQICFYTDIPVEEIEEIVQYK